jgi:hypothetical protein
MCDKKWRLRSAPRYHVTAHPPRFSCAWLGGVVQVLEETAGSYGGVGARRNTHPLVFPPTPLTFAQRLYVSSTSSSRADTRAPIALHTRWTCGQLMCVRRKCSRPPRAPLLTPLSPYLPLYSHQGCVNITDRFVSGFEWMATLSAVATSKFDRVHRQGSLELPLSSTLCFFPSLLAVQ